MEGLLTIERIAMIIISVGITYLIKGQRSIRIEAKQGRKELHEKIDRYINKLTTLEAQHKINHPGQL